MLGVEFCGRESGESNGFLEGALFFLLPARRAEPIPSPVLNRFGGVSSVGRASAWHAEGQRFESATLHHFTFFKKDGRWGLASFKMMTGPRPVFLSNRPILYRYAYWRRPCYRVCDGGR